MELQLGEFYYLSTEGYFFNYLPIEGNRIECKLFKEGKGSAGIDKQVITKDDFTLTKHHEIINHFEAQILLGRY